MEDAKPVIMVVDDQSDLIDGVKLILEVEGYKVWTATNGQHALDKLELEGSRVIPHLILADIMMPVMDGYELFERVKANPSWQKIPFIFLTAKVEEIDIEKGKKLGVDVYLTKPAQPDDLLSSIREKLKESGGMMPSKLPEIPPPPPSSNNTVIIIGVVVAILIILAIAFFMMSG